MISTRASGYAVSNNIYKELEMAITRRIFSVVITALILVAIIALSRAKAPASAQGQVLLSNGVSAPDCSPIRHTGASDGDRFNLIRVEIPETGGDSQASSTNDCLALHYIAASDGDQLASEMYIPKTGTGEVKNLIQRFREAEDACWKAWLVYRDSH
jgi:hypothetical protein